MQFFTDALFNPAGRRAELRGRDHRFGGEKFYAEKQHEDEGEHLHRGFDHAIAEK